MSHYCGRKECLGKRVHLKRDCPVAARLNAAKRAKQRAAAESSKTSFRKKPTSGYARCDVCEGLARAVKNDSGVVLGFERHRAPGMGTWCRNGTYPVTKPTGKGSKKVKRSVRTVRGGLPSLGKR